MKKQFILLLLSGASVLFVQGQTVEENGALIENVDPKLDGVANDFEQKETIQPAESPLSNVAAMVKQVLGEVYVEVDHIPEPQWFEMEPIAEEYVNALFEARRMADDEAATRLAQDALVKFKTDIEAKLTNDQKNVRSQKRAETDVKIQQQKEQLLSVKEEARQILQNDSPVSENTEALKSPQTLKGTQVTKTIISNQSDKKAVKFEFQ